MGVDVVSAREEDEEEKKREKEEKGGNCTSATSEGATVPQRAVRPRIRALENTALEAEGRATLGES